MEGVTSVAPGSLPGEANEPPRLRGGTRHARLATDDFQDDLRHLLQKRLLICCGVLGLVGAILLAISGTTGCAEEDWDLNELLSFRYYVHAAAVLVLLGAWLLLRRRQPVAYGALLVVDAVTMLVVVMSSVAAYALEYRKDPYDIPAFLALFLVARALVVPSTIRRTLLVSLAGLAGILAVQLYHGATFENSGVPRPDETFVSHVIWNQVVLGLALGISLLAAHLNHSLRVKAYEARRMDQYVLEGLIGKGGMGKVYRARHTLMQRPTALKLLHPEKAGRRDLQRFEREVRHTCLLTHPNTIRIYDYGHTPAGEFFYAMELLDGADLHRVVEATGPLPPGRAVHVLRQVCAALSEAHARGLVHRDVKASNLMLCRQGLDDDVVKVLDFGLVKETENPDGGLTEAGEAPGTPTTMAPETILGQEVTAQADIYSLGAVGYYLVSGLPLYKAKTASEYAVKHVTEMPMAPSQRGIEVPGDLEALLMRCLEKQPADRPESALELARALDDCEGVEPWTQVDAKRWWREHGDRLERSGSTAE